MIDKFFGFLVFTWQGVFISFVLWVVGLAAFLLPAESSPHMTPGAFSAALMASGVMAFILGLLCCMLGIGIKLCRLSR